MAWILAASVAAVAVGAAAVGALALTLRGQGGSPAFGNAHLFVRVQGELPEQPRPNDLSSLLERRPPSLRALVESLDRAARDPKLTALVLRVDTLSDAHWGKLQELRDAVVRFKAAGKPAYCHLEYCGNKEYYLATACTEISALPTALVDVSGLSAEVTFFRKTLDTLGIKAQFEGIGKYKNAPNQYTEAGFTEPHREQMDALLDSLFEQYVEAVAQGRKKTPEEVRALVDAGPYDASEALKAGLVDKLQYEDDLEARLRRSSRTTPVRYLKGAGRAWFDSRPRVALVYAVGDIVPGESQSGAFGELAGSDTVAAALRQARGDDSIRAVILRVDSPGGFGPAADVIWREVAVTRKSKPVVASMGDYAASGGYYIAMGSDAIVAQPGTITGSIGVFGGKLSLRGLYDKLGLTKEVLTRGRHADIYSSYRPWSDEERAKLRGQMQAFYRDFVSRAASGRKRSYQEIDDIAQGRVWTGREALANGLVDKLGGLETALGIAREKAGIGRDQDVALVTLPERKGLFESLLERQEEAVDSTRLSVPADLQGMLRLLRGLAAGGLMARLPFDLRVR